jgi:hypothetical protein
VRLVLRLMGVLYDFVALMGDAYSGLVALFCFDVCGNCIVEVLFSILTGLHFTCVYL